MLDHDQTDARALIFMSAQALLAGITPESLSDQIRLDTLVHGPSVEETAETIAALVIEAAKIVSGVSEMVTEGTTRAAP